MSVRRAAAITAALLASAGCSGTQPHARASITVLAASSLTEAFRDAGARYGISHHVTVTFSFGASSTLAQQIESGSPGDVFASADERTMNSVVQASDVRGTPKIFALNKLEIAVAPGDPKRIAGLADLARRDLQVALCAPQVPCGAFAAQALARARVTVPRASQEQDVKAVLTKVRLGEADAGIVYATDVRAAGSSVAGVAIPDSLNVVARYPIVLLRSASPAAQGFVDFVLSPAGAAILRRYGFSIP